MPEDLVGSKEVRASSTSSSDMWMSLMLMVGMEREEVEGRVSVRTQSERKC